MSNTLSELLDAFAMSRRRFLQRVGLAAGAAAGAAPLSVLAEARAPDKPLRVVTVGAGLAGLCAAYELEQLGHEAIVLEAHPSRIGGRVFTHRASTMGTMVSWARCVSHKCMRSPAITSTGSACRCALSCSPIRGLFITCAASACA